MSISYTNLQQSFHKLSSNRMFEFFVVSIIIFSALIVGAKTYDISDNVLKIISILDWTITLIFLTEITIRFIATPVKSKFFHSGWNVFDTLIVTVSLIPIDNSEMAMLGRLIRIFRVLRMISIIPELRVLVNSLIKAMPQLGYVMLLMFIIFYIYAAVGSTFFFKINQELWGDISISMLTLFRVMTFEDWTDVMYETMAVYPLSWLFYLSFIFFTAFAFLNMVIGIVVNVLEEERAKEKAENAKDNGEATMQTLMLKLEHIQAEIKSLRTQRSLD
ncbi:MAG: ion transporter [Proteobacteria bacterium]|nr:ion transporter [Pseudomonadota bacterium]